MMATLSRNIGFLLNIMYPILIIENNLVAGIQNRLKKIRLYGFTYREKSMVSF